MNKIIKLLFSSVMIVVLLTGCATPISKVGIPPNLMQPCTHLNKLDGLTGKQLIQNIVSNAELYHNCADGKAALIEAIKSGQ